MKIALWGSYSEGNFGDDLMALAFARTCIDQGATVSGFCVPESFARHGIAKADTLTELLRQADLCVIGGGEFLFRSAPLKRLLRSYFRRFEVSCADLADAVERATVPLAAVSVGGDGTTHFQRLSRDRRRLFGSRHLISATVRLPSDLQTLSRLGNRAAYFPDALLATPLLFPFRNEGARKTLRVGLNLHRSLGISFVERLREHLKGRADVELVAIRSHSERSGHDYELAAADVDGAIEEHRYLDPIDTSRFLSSLDVVVSSKLHVGVVALAYGARFISFGGKPKARSFVATIGEGEYYPSNEVDRALAAVATSISDVATGSIHVRRTTQHAEAAYGHFRTLQSLVS